MKMSFVALAATVGVAMGVVALKDRDFIANKLYGSSALSSRATDALPSSAMTPVNTNQPPAVQIAQFTPVADTSGAATPPAAVAASPDTTVTTPVASAPAADAVDESALRYFASRGDTTRLEAEIARLRSLYPNWTPPENPLAIPENTDRKLESMWQLYSQARYADVRKAIDDRTKAEPGWQPPADLLDRLKIAETRAGLVTASDAKDYKTVVDLAVAAPSLLTCSEIDVLWRVAEAFGRTDRQARSRDAYLYILNNCDSSDERVATIQKAAELLPIPMMDDLLAREKKDAKGAPEFERLRDDLARRFVADANAKPDVIVPAPYVSRLERLAQTGGLETDARLLGWYYIGQKNMAAAEPWFRAARKIQDSPAASQGLALTLIARQADAEAEEVMYPWYSTSKEAKAVYLAAVANLLAIDPPIEIDSKVLQRMVPVVTEAKDPAAAQQFGWYARALLQPETAAQWFTTALSWKIDDEPSAYGLALSRNDLQDTAGVAELQRVWGARSERIARLGEPEEDIDPRTLRPRPVLQQQVVERKQNRLPRQPVEARLPVRRAVEERQVVEDRPRAIRVNGQRPATSARKTGCSTTQNPTLLSAGEALTRGWCLMEINRPVEAAAAFDVALTGGNPDTREQASYGQSLAYLRLGLTEKAAVAATQAPQTRARAVELQTAILTNRALGAFEAGRNREAILALDQRAMIATEQMDLMVVRGYAYLNMNRYGDARRIFEALAQSGHREGIRGLASTRDRASRPNRL